jgi:hypothetical protein
MFDIESAKRTLADVEAQIREWEITRAVLRRMVAGGQVISKRKPKVRKDTYRQLMTKIMKKSGPRLTTGGLAEKLSQIKGKKVSVTAVRMALHRGEDTFQKFGTREWGLKKRTGEKK